MRDEDVAILTNIVKAYEDLSSNKYMLESDYYEKKAISKMFKLQKLYDAFDKVTEELYAFIKDAKTSDYDVYTNIEREYSARYDCKLRRSETALKKPICIGEWGSIGPDNIVMQREAA